MSDVWRELMERLKQKAKSYLEITLEIAKEVDVAKTEKGEEPKVKEPKWVRLEDVLSELKKLQENHIIIEKKKFKDEIVCGQLSTNAIINDIHERIEEIIKSFVSFRASFIEELLKE